MKNYDFKDAFMILKAIEKEANRIYKSKNEMIVNQLEKLPNNQYRCKYGLLNLKTNAEKTEKVYTKEEIEEINKLLAQQTKIQAKIDKLGTTQVVKASYKSLVCNANAIAENEAKDLLIDVITAIGNATMIKASKR